MTITHKKKKLFSQMSSNMHMSVIEKVTPSWVRMLRMLFCMHNYLFLCVSGGAEDYLERLEEAVR